LSLHKFVQEEEGEESDGEPSAAQVWQEALHKRAEEKGAMVCLLGNLDGNEEDEGGLRLLVLLAQFTEVGWVHTGNPARTSTGP
jgi:hypothetical protein